LGIFELIAAKIPVKDFISAFEKIKKEKFPQLGKKNEYSFHNFTTGQQYENDLMQQLKRENTVVF